MLPQQNLSAFGVSFRHTLLGLGSVFALSMAPPALAQTSGDFNVAVNVAPTAPNNTTVFPGEQTTLRITLSNNSTVNPIANATYAGTLPADAIGDLLIDGAPVISPQPDCGGTATGVAGSPNISFSGITVPVNIPGTPGSGECYVDIPVRASTDGGSTSLSYVINAGEVQAQDALTNPISNGSGGNQSLTVRAVSSPTLSKAFTPNNIVVLGGQTRTLRITVNNPDSNVPLTDAAFSDLFPTSGAGGAVIEPTGAAATGSCVAGGAIVGLTQGAAAGLSISNLSTGSNDSCVIDVEVRARQTDGVYERNATNIIDNESFSSREGPIPAADATASVRVRSPLAVGKIFTPSIIASGTEGQFTVTLSNNSDAPLSVANFVDDPIGTPNPGNLLIDLASDISNSCPGGAESLESGGQGFSVAGFDIPAQGSCTITVTYTGTNLPADADRPITYTNTIPEGAVDIAGAPELISQARSATVIVADRLRILKEADPSQATPGEAVEYEITVQNFSASALNDVRVADTLENGSTLLASAPFAPTVSGSCGLNTNGAADGDTAINFTLTEVPARTVGPPDTPGECVITFSVMIDPLATGSTSNVIGAGDVCFGPLASEICNQSASNTVSTALRAPVEFEKTIDGANSVTKSEGTTARLRLELRNFAPEALTDITFSDPFPQDGAFAQLRVASPPNVSNSCGGTVTAAADTTSVALNGGTVPAIVGNNPGICAVEVDIIGPAGSYPNTAEATGNRPNADGTVTAIAPAGSPGTPLSDSATINYTPALQATKSFTPSSAGDGSTSTLEIRFSNVSASQPVTNVEVTDTLPAGMVIASPANAYSTCGGSAVVTAVEGSNSLSISGANLAPGVSCAVLTEVVASGTSDWVNTIPAGAITADNGITNPADIEATLTYVAPDVPLISKTISPGTIVPGQSAELTVTITSANQDLSGMSLVDWFTDDGTAGGANNGMSIAPVALPSTSCAGGVVTAVSGGNSLRLSGASLPANSSCTFSAQVTSTSVGTLVNRIPFNSIVSDQGATNVTTFAESSLNTTSDVGITKRFEPRVVGANEDSRLRIEFFNGQGTAVTDFAITDTYPAGLTNAANPNPISSCGGAAVLTLPDSTSISISNGSIPAASGTSAGSCFVEVNVVSTTEGTYENTIPANTLTVQGVPVPHPPASGELQVRERIMVTKAIDDLTLDADLNGFSNGTALRLPGVPAPLTIRLENPNTIPLTQVTFTDELPSGLTLAIPPNASTTCTDGVVAGGPNARELTLTGATLAATGDAGAICTVTADVYSNVAGVYTNEIPAGAVTSFEGVDNDPPTQAQIVVTEPPTIGKEFIPPVIAPGAVATLRLTLGNVNDVSGNLTSELVDSLPATPGAMRVAATPNITSSCPGGTGIVSAGAGDTEVRVQNGAEIPAGGCVVTVDVTADDAGEYLNNIPVGALQTTLGPNEVPTEAPLLVSTLGYISGKVFLDNQTLPDGVFIPGGSTPIAGNTVELRSGASCTGTLLETTTTDAQGNYLFSELPAGVYSVCQPTQPPDTLNSVTTEGTIVGNGGSTGTPGAASNPSTTTSQITSIELNSTADPNVVSGSPDNNFSEVEPASISGNVYFDESNDGVFDGGESGIGGVTIQLTGPVTLTTTTAPDGSWSFDGLPPGDYTVTEVQPGGWTDGQDTAGTVDGVATGDDSSDDVIASVTLGPGDAGVEYNFGELLPATFTLNASASCSNNAPYVDYSLDGFAPGSTPNVTMRWVTTGGRVVAELPNQPGSGRLLWPGAVVDGAGMGIGWPGWSFDGSEWTMVPDDRVPEIVLVADFGTTGQTTVTYPRSTSSCAAQPPGTFARSIPVAAPWMYAVLILMLGAIVGAGLRRRSPPSP